MTLTDTSVELRRLRTMMLIRRFEERTYQEYTKPGQKIGGFCHLSSGQEALPVGAAGVFRRGTDWLVNSYRCHGYALALGMSPRAAMAEMFGKATGCCHGKSGSMHLFDAENGNLGGWPLAGAQVPLGIGTAFAAWYRRTGGVGFVVFGDGALGQGVVHESLNLASLWKLPAVLLVEDNGIAIGTRVERHSADPDLVRRGGAYAMPCRGFDGNDVEAVVANIGEAADRARAGGGPTYLVARTFRFRGWIMSDAMKYRTREEMQQAKLRDPITLYEARLRERGLLDDEQVDAMQDDVNREIEQAIARADADPNPPVDFRFADVLAHSYPWRWWRRPY